MAFNYGQAAGFVVPTRIPRSSRARSCCGRCRRWPAASATPAACSSRRATTTPGRCCATGRRRCRWTPPLGPLVKTRGRDVLRGQRDAEAAPARLRARGVPQPRRLQRLPAALGRERLRSRRWRCAATTRRWRDEFMALDTVDVKQSRAVKKNIAPASGGITHRAGPILEDSVADRHAPARSRSTPRRTRAPSACSRNGTASSAMDRAGVGVGDGVGQHAAAGVRVAPAERRHAAAVRHLRGRRRSQAGRRDRWTRTAASPAVGNIRSALGPCAGLRPAATSTCAAPSGATTAPRWSSRRRPGAASGLDLWLLDVAGGHLPPAHQRRRPHGQRPVSRAQLRSGVRARRQRRVRVDARRDADADDVAAQLGPVSRRARTSTSRNPRADDVPAQLGDLRRPSCRTAASA